MQLLIEEECRLLGRGHLLGLKSEDQRWHPERLLLYHCTECRYARLSISGLLRGETSPIQNPAGAQRECSYRLVLHHSAEIRDEGALMATPGDSHIGDSQAREDNVWLAPPGRRLIQQSVSPSVFVSADLPEEESYAPAKWTYFVGDKEVRKEGFREQLERAYAARRQE